MSPSALALLVSLAQAPAPCGGERVALTPFEPVALERAEARALEEAVRRAAQGTAGVCLAPRALTVEQLRAGGGRLPVCEDAACRGAQVAALGAERLLRGVALGVGGTRSVALTLVGRDGAEARTSFQVEQAQGQAGAEARARESFAALWASRPLPPGAAVVARPPSPWPRWALAAGAVTLATGAGFGLASRHTQQQLSRGSAGCTGEGEDFRRCFGSRLEQGRQQAQWANALMGAGAVLAAGGVLLLVWDVP